MTQMCTSSHKIIATSYVGFDEWKNVHFLAIWVVDKWFISFGNNCVDPKFAIFGFKSLSRSMLDVLMSRCIMHGCKYS